ncbi:unnamed protein product [Gordionus sp. m RMFG-2023]
MVNSWSGITRVLILAPSNQTHNILEKKESLKIAKYSEISQEYILIPIISTTLTTFGEMCFIFPRNLAFTYANTNEPREGFFLRQRLANKTNFISFIGSFIPQDD